jgi:hypothetical protein
MYGENGRLLGAELATLLRQHRIQQRLGGPGIHTVPESTTPEQREALGEQISRYRHAVLVWCLQAVRAATPSIELERTTGRSRGPAEKLRYRLTRAVDSSTAGQLRLVELTTEQEFPMVESWRHAARAAALGEHDFGPGVGYGRLTEAQCMTVLKDAAEITRGLVVLDRRYAGIPGWKPLQDQRRLGLTAEACAALAGNEEPDYTVDLRGWRPPITTIHGPALPGIAGVLQAEHNLLVHLTEFPNAHNLRLVLHSQRVLSNDAALRGHDTAPTLANKWRTRARTYTALIRATRDLGGHLGAGGHAAAEGANALGRLRRLRPDAIGETNPLRHLDPLFTRIDDRISDIIEQGARERLYFLRVKLPRIVDQPERLIRPIRERYVPLNSADQTDLLDIVRSELRAPPTPPAAPSGAARSRGELIDAITHRPESRRTDLSI